MAACAKSLGGAVLFTATTDTYTDLGLGSVMIRGIEISGGSVAGAITLNEGVSAGGLADGSGAIVADVYAAIGAQVYLNFAHRPFLANKGLKLSALPTGAIVTVYLA
jgi:hypothetical protein